MSKFTIVVSVLAMLVAFGPTSVIAQTTPLSDAEIVVQCAQSDLCDQLVIERIAALRAQGLTPTQIDASLTTLVIALVEATPGNPARRGAISQALNVAQASITDPQIRDEVAAINQAVIAGGGIETAALGEVASPN